jgi:hypothetical protein
MKAGRTMQSHGRDEYVHYPSSAELPGSLAGSKCATYVGVNAFAMEPRIVVEHGNAPGLRRWVSVGIISKP